MRDESWVRANVERTLAGDVEGFGELVESFQSTWLGFIAMLGAPVDRIGDLA